jgi:hypothetical protein
MIVFKFSLPFLCLFIFFSGFGQTPTFDEFKVPSLYTGQKAEVDTRSTTTGRMFRTRLKEVYKQEGLNFAGHYCFVYWGCGSPCKQSAIIDLKTGKIYDGPSGTRTYDFQKNSRMIILNREDDFSRNNPDCIWCKTEVWVWNEKGKHFYQLK